MLPSCPPSFDLIDPGKSTSNFASVVLSVIKVNGQSTAAFCNNPDNALGAVRAEKQLTGMPDRS